MEPFDNRYGQDEELYPASNGGYYNRNVYSDKYFQGHPNVLKFYDLPNLDKTQKAQLRYNPNLDVDRRQGDNGSNLDVTQSLIGRNYSVSSRKNSGSDSTYRAFGEDDSEDDNYAEDGGYDELQAMQSQRQRQKPQHQYERPNFDPDGTRTIARLTSFRHTAQAAVSVAPPLPPPPRADSITR